jgi:hypothetical protein
MVENQKFAVEVDGPQPILKPDTSKIQTYVLFRNTLEYKNYNALSLPITVAARSKASMFVCIYSMFVLSCVSSGLVMADLQTKDLY